MSRTNDNGSERNSAFLNSNLPRILGACFYTSPLQAPVSTLVPLLAEVSQLFPWQQPDTIEALGHSLASFSPDLLAYDFSILFEGQGVMPAPPWGSVYLQQDNLLLGPSTLDYRHFLAQQGVQFSSQQQEPEDQFGLMLLALAQLLELQRPEAAGTLLSAHLLTWSSRYLQLVQETPLEQPFYHRLAQLARCDLQELADGLQLTVAPVPLYR
ncbi:MAG: molecular chaperone TorD family protein [Enterobacteriaceae bacterium]